MSDKIEVLEGSSRASEKQASRDKDAARLASGSVSRQELKRENSFFAALPLKNFRVRSVGAKRVNHSR